MMVFNHKGTLAVAILIAIYGSLIECQIEGIRTTNLNSTHPLHASTFGITYPSNTSTSAPTTQFSSVYFNVSDATFVQTSAYIQIRDAIVYQTNSSYTSPTPGSITGSFGAIVPPCFPSNRSESYYSASEFNATTDALYGEATFTYGDVAVPTLVNGSTSFEIKCRVPGLSKCIDYYSLTISLTPVVSHLYVLSVTSTNNLTLHFALKNNNTECSSLQYPVSANKREDVGLPVVEEKPLDFWLGIETSDDSPSAQVQMWWILYGSDTPSGDNTPNSPSSQTPESNNSPSGNIVDELPRWALVLLIIFGIAVLVLIIVVIVLCVKRNKRVQYSTM